MTEREFDTLTRLLAEQRIGRRTFLRRVAALGVGAGAVSAALSDRMATPAAAQGTPAIPTVPEVKIRYASLQAIDHTHIVIPVKRGWNKDVGITIEPPVYGTSAGADKIVSI